jgi:hypothetical protein
MANLALLYLECVSKEALNHPTAQHVGRMLKDVFTSSAVLLPAGTTLMTSATAGPEAVAVNGTITGITAVLKGIESWTGKDKGLPFGALAVANALTVVSTAYKTISNHTSDTPLKDLTAGIGMSLAYVGWGTRSFLMSRNLRNGKAGNAAESMADNPRTYDGLGCLAANADGHVPDENGELDEAQMVSSALAGMGLARSASVGEQTRLEGWRGYVLKNFTAAHLYALSFAATPVIKMLTGDETSGNELAEDSAYGIWTAAYLTIDNKKKPAPAPTAA